MKKLFLTILCIQLAALCLAQYDTSLKLLKIIQGDITDFTADNLGNLYVLTRDNQLKKLGPDGDSLSAYNDVRRFGKVYSIDATNPLKLLLFYRDFGTIVVLDRFLNVRTTLNLRQKNIFQVKAVGQSYDNNIWLYDEQEARLKKLNEEGVALEQFSDLRQIMDTAPSPVEITDNNRLLYLYDPGNGLYVFDYFGTLKNKIALLGWQDVQVVGDQVFGRKNNVLQQYRPGTLAWKEFPLGSLFAQMNKMVITSTRLYCLKDGAIHLYSF